MVDETLNEFGRDVPAWNNGTIIDVALKDADKVREVNPPGFLPVATLPRESPNLSTLVP